MNATESKVIVLTGSTRGIGRSLVERFLETGHRVLGCGRSAAAIAELRSAHAAPSSFEVVDVADPVSVAAWAEGVLAEHGAPDLLINNAALMNGSAPLWEVPAEEFDALMAVNVSGTANVVRSYVPAMIERGSGVIVNMSSGWGRSTSPDVGPYCTTKWAIEGYTSSLSQELPPGLAAVALSPGCVDTDMLRQCWAEDAAAYDGPEAWSERGAAYILGLEARHNGQSLTVS